MNRRKYLQGLGGMALGGMTALAGCSALATEDTGESDNDDTVAATVGGKGLWMGHKRESRDPASTSVIQVWPDEAWIDERIEPRISADNDDIEPETPLAELPVSEIAAELKGFRTWVVFALQLSTRDEINDNDRVTDGDGYYWYVGPTAFYDHVDLESKHTFRVAEPGEYYDGSAAGRIIDIV
jgi:hypothetical protein